MQGRGWIWWVMGWGDQTPSAAGKGLDLAGAQGAGARLQAAKNQSSERGGVRLEHVVR